MDWLVLNAPTAVGVGVGVGVGDGTGVGVGVGPAIGGLGVPTESLPPPPLQAARKPKAALAIIRILNFISRPQQ